MTKPFSPSKWTSLLTVIFVSACSSVGKYSETIVPYGATLELTQTVRVSFGMSPAFIQQGDLVRWGDVNRFSAYCFFVTKRDDRTKSPLRQIEPTQFKTGKTQTRVYANQGYIKPVQVASTDLAMMVSPGTPYPFVYTTTIPIHSDDEPRITHLNCAYWGDASGPALSIRQIKDSLGQLVKFL